MLPYASLGVGREADVGFERMIGVEGAEEVAVKVFVGGFVIRCGIRPDFGLRRRRRGPIVAGDAAIGAPCFGGRGTPFFVPSPLPFLRLALLNNSRICLFRFVAMLCAAGRAILLRLGDRRCR